MTLTVNYVERLHKVRSLFKKYDDELLKEIINNEGEWLKKLAREELEERKKQ